MHDDVEALAAEVLTETPSDSLDAEVSPIAVALLQAKLLRSFFEHVVLRVQRIDPFELELPPVR